MSPFPLDCGHPVAGALPSLSKSTIEHNLEGLKNEVICRDRRALDLIPVRLIPMQEAICTALTEAQSGPGKLPSGQSCFYR
jgi:hypothetical protein